MSGGRFDYIQFRIQDTADELKELIEIFRDNEFSKETIDKFNECYTMLNIGAKILNRIDYLVCNDDSEETFHKRLNEDLNTPLDTTD